MPDMTVEVSEDAGIDTGTDDTAEAGTGTAAEATTEIETVETIIIVPGAEGTLSRISGRLDSIFVLGVVVAFLLLVLCFFTIVRRSD